MLKNSESVHLRTVLSNFKFWTNLCFQTLGAHLKSHSDGFRAQITGAMPSGRKPTHGKNYLMHTRPGEINLSIGFDLHAHR